MPQSEHARLRAYTRGAVIAAGGWCCSTTGAMAAGLPDVIGCIDGQMVAMEVKTGRARLTPLQTVTLERIRAAGGIGEVVRSREDVRAVIARIRVLRSVMGAEPPEGPPRA